MQDPVKEIKDVVCQLTAGESPDTQRAAVYKYYAPDAGLYHPLSRVEPGTLSRESILGVYQWYRILSPNVSTKVTNVVYDKPHNVLLLDVEHTFHVSFLPVKPMPSQLLVRLSLREDNGLHYIVLQEDFFDPNDLAALVFPPAAPIVRFTLRTFGTAFNICAKLSQVLGYWRPQTNVVRSTGERGESSNGQASSNVPRHENNGARVQVKKKSNGKRGRGHNSLNQGGGDEFKL